MQEKVLQRTTDRHASIEPTKDTQPSAGLKEHTTATPNRAVLQRRASEQVKLIVENAPIYENLKANSPVDGVASAQIAKPAIIEKPATPEVPAEEVDHQIDVT
jgi:hypothetical protein